MIATALAVEECTEEQELSKEAFVISLLARRRRRGDSLHPDPGGAPAGSAPVLRVQAPLRPLLLLFLLLLATVLLARALVISD